MNTLLIHTGKSGIALLIFYLFFRLILSKDQAFVRTRFYFTGAILVSGILPWFNIPLIPVQPEAGNYTFAYLSGTTNIQAQNLNDHAWQIDWMILALYLYLTGVFIFTLKTLVSYLQVGKIIIRGKQSNWGEMQLIETSENVSPFSFFHWLVVPQNLIGHPSFEKMAQHELVHRRQYHSVDLFIAELMLILQWFNPIAWLVRKSMVENLEFIVDRKILAVGTNARDYQYALLHFSLGGLQPSIANSFSTNLLKKRITMMNNCKMNKYAYLHNLLIPVILVLAMMVTVSFTKVETENVVVRNKSIQPPVTDGKIKTSLPESDLQTKQKSDVSGEEIFLKYMMQNLKYPLKALESQQTGSVTVQVVFGKNGLTFSESSQSTPENKFRDVVVVGYSIQKENQATNAPSTSDSKEFLISEVKRVASDLKEIPADLAGKTYSLHVIFVLQTDDKKVDIKPTVKILVEQTPSGKSKEPVYILNDEKIISKAELDAIDPITIQSVNVIKADKVEHKTLGVINNSVIIITTKK